MSNTAPAIPLFGDAYLADTHHLTLEEHGAYLKLLMIAWRTEGCALPADDMRLAKMVGVTKAKWGKLKPVVMAFWSLADGQWTQRRLTKERAFVDKKREANRAAAETRWKPQPIENARDEACDRISERNAPPPPPPQVTEEEVEAAPQLRAAPQPVSEAFDGWNERASSVGWPTVTKRTAERQAKLRAILRSEGLEGWLAAVDRARASPFLAGRDPPQWFGFDFIVKPGNFAKLIEGNYDRDRSSTADKRPRARAAVDDAFSGLEWREPSGSHEGDRPLRLVAGRGAA